MNRKNNQLEEGTILEGTYRIGACVGRLRHSEYEFSSFIYQATAQNGMVCTVYEYFPDSWDCVAWRDDRQNVCWNFEKIRQRMREYGNSFKALSPDEFLNDTLKHFSEDAVSCMNARKNGLISSNCVINCETFRAHGTCYVVLPKHHAQYSLFDLVVKNEKLAGEDETEALLQACTDGLRILHRQEISHGAISPFNIVFSAGQPVLTEFGKPKARKFSSLANLNGPMSEGALWFDPDSPEWYNKCASEKDADAIAIRRILHFCTGKDWDDSARDLELIQSHTLLNGEL